MTRLGASTFDELLELLEAPAPAPAGGSAAALAAAMAASLVIMVARGSRAWADGPERASRAGRLRALLVELAETDARAVGRLLDVLREPAGADRADQLARALVDASDPPVAIAAAAAEVVELAVLAEANGKQVMRADAAAAAALARAATSSAVLIAETNVNAIAAGSVPAEASVLLQRARAAAEAARG